MNDHLRQTGRTTRLMGQAVSLAAQGRAVYIFAHNSQYAQRMQRDFEAQFPSVKSVKFDVLPEGFNWRSMQPGGPRHHPNCVFLVDQCAVELHLIEVDKQIMQLQQLARQLYQLTL